MSLKFLIAVAIASSLLVAVESRAQQSPVKIEASQVRGNIYMITGQGGNIGLLTGDEGSFMVDDQFAPLTEKIIEAKWGNGIFSADKWIEVVYPAVF